MASRISLIKLDKFKGATNPVTIELDISKPAVMIFGENGTGKSTVVDALDFICNEGLGSIEDRSVGGSKAKHLPSSGYKAKDMKLEMQYDGRTFIGTIGAGSQPDITGTGAKPTARILRRSSIMKIVDGKPKDRYDEIKGFFNVPNAQKVEDALRTARENTKTEYEGAVSAYQQAEQVLTENWEGEGKPEGTFAKWAKGKSEVDSTSLTETSKQLGSFIQKYTASTNAATSLTESETSVTSSQETYEKALEVFESAKKKVEGEGKDIIDVLQKAKEFLLKYEDLTYCPVCEKPNNAKELTSSIDNRLVPLNDLIAAKKAFEAAKKKLDSDKKILEARKTDWIVKIAELGSYVKGQPIDEVTALNIKWEDYSALLAFKKTDNPEPVLTVTKKLSEILDGIKSAIEARKVQVDKEASQLKLIKTNYRIWTEKQVQAKRLEKQHRKLIKLHDIVAKERKDFIANTLLELSGEVDRLYLKIHPDEGLGKVKLFLNPKFIGSLEITGQFQDTSDVPPQAYYSESHLDTLGVCLFLALALKYKDDNTVVVLDDVITSIDQAHMDRFIDMLHDEADKFNQLFITSHYKPWKERYRRNKGPAANIQLVELLSWSQSKGVRHSKIQLSVDELEDYLGDEKYDGQIVASKAGLILEGILDHIAINYGCRLPRKPEPKYTIGEFILSIEKKLKKALVVKKNKADGSSTSTEVSALLDDIDAVTWIRNSEGCHLTIDSTISDGEIKHFGALTARFAKALICDNCGELPYRDKSGSYWDCRCGQTQMHPLQIPS